MSHTTEISGKLLVALVVVMLTTASGAVLAAGATDAVAGSQQVTDEITFDDQSSDGAEVTVASAQTTSQPFFYVAVWTVDPDTGELDEVQGWVQVPTMSAENVEVAFNDSITESQTMAATIQPDNDGDPTTQDPLLNPDDAIVEDQAEITVGEAPADGEPTGSITFDDQETDGGSVIVANASNTSSPFYVTVWAFNNSTGEYSVLQGVARITATSDEDVEVSLPLGLTENQTLLAAVAVDDDGVPATFDPNYEALVASDTANVTVVPSEAVEPEN